MGTFRCSLLGTILLLCIFMYKEPFTLQHVFEIKMFFKYFLFKKNPLAPNFRKEVYTVCSCKWYFEHTFCNKNVLWEYYVENIFDVCPTLENKWNIFSSVQIYFYGTFYWLLFFSFFFLVTPRGTQFENIWPTGWIVYPKIKFWHKGLYKNDIIKNFCLNWLIWSNLPCFIYLFICIIVIIFLFYVNKMLKSIKRQLKKNLV